MSRLCCVLSIALCVGCAPATSQLDDALQIGNYKKAVALAGNDPAKQRILAAHLLELTAGSGVRSYELVDTLWRTGSSGKPSLKRLAKQTHLPAGRLAEVFLDKNRFPRKKSLNRYLGDESSDVRAAAAKAWNRHMDSERLIRLLADIDGRVRRAAVVGLARKATSDKIQSALYHTLRLDPEPKVRSAAAKNGHVLGHRSLVALKDALTDENQGVRLAALRGLAKTKREAGLLIVRAYATAPLDEMAVAAAAELAHHGHAPGLERLLAGLESRRPEIRIAALLRLERGKVKNIDAIAASLLDDPSPRVVYQAASRLATNTKHRQAVIHALKKIELEHSNHADQARDLLAIMGDEKAMSRVSEALKKSGKRHLLQTLSRVGRIAALGADFVPLMADPDQEIRIAAAKAVLTANP